jgi:hypothetical protein
VRGIRETSRRRLVDGNRTARPGRIATRWIDEADPIFGRLRLWQPDADGVGTLATLSQKQVGAIYLGQAATPFAVKNAQNELLGQVVSSGIYLAETGGAGSVQQVDLAV